MKKRFAKPGFWPLNGDSQCLRSCVASSQASLNGSAATTRHVMPPSADCEVELRWEEGNCPRERSYTTVPSFVDTNILVYAEDRNTKAKHETARDLVIELWEKREGVLSIQVLQEFYVTATRKLKKPLSAAKAREIVHEYLTWTVVENTSRLLTAALVLHQSAQLSFWDAMVVQAAVEAGCDTLYSEDLNAGQRFGSVVVVNPFK
jgi:predicted nucleic acid-binding protein